MFQCPVKTLAPGDRNILVLILIYRLIMFVNHRHPGLNHFLSQSPCSQSQDMFYEWEMLEDISDVLSKERLSIESVVVKGCPVALQSLYTGVEKPTYTACHLLPSTETVYPPSIQTQSSQMASGLNVTAAPPVSFFQWQIQQEEEKLAALSHVEVTSKDDDGDT